MLNFEGPGKVGKNKAKSWLQSDSRDEHTHTLLTLYNAGKKIRDII